MADASHETVIHAAVAALEEATEAMREKRLDDAESILFVVLANVDKAAVACEGGEDEAPVEIKLLKARVIGNLGNVLYRKGGDHLEQALEHFRDARRMFHELGDGVREGSICISTANALDRLGMHVEAVAMMRDFLRLAEQYGAPAKRREFAEVWIARRTGTAKDSAAIGTSHSSADAPSPTARPPPSVRLTPMQALEAAAEAADTPLSDLVNPASASMVTPMLEFGFENLAFSDVLARSQRSLRMLSAVSSMLRARAAAEERFAEALAASKAEEAAAGVVGEVTAGIWSALGSVVGAGTVALGMDDPLGVSGAVSADAADALSPPGAELDTSDGRPGDPSAAAGKWDNGSIAAAVAAIERHASSEAGRRRRLAAAWNQGVAQLSALKAHHDRVHKEGAAAAETLVRNVSAARRKLSKAHVRLRKAQRAEAEAKAGLRRAHEALSAIVDKAGGDVDAAAKLDGGRAMREVQAEAGRRSKQVERATTEAGSAEAAMQAAVVEHLTARRTRDSQLAQIARRFQAAEEARLEGMAGALRLAGERWQLVQTASAEAGDRLARAVDRVDPSSDLRMFVHQRRVVRRVREQKAELQRWEGNREEAERRRTRRIQATAEAAQAQAADGAAAEGAEAADEATDPDDGASKDGSAEGGAAGGGGPSPASSGAGAGSADDATAVAVAAAAVRAGADGAAADGAGSKAGARSGWLSGLRGGPGRRSRGTSAETGGLTVASALSSKQASTDADDSGEGLEGLREEDDEGLAVVPVSVSRERALTFASDSMRAEAELAPVARAWVASLFEHASHGSYDGPRDHGQAAAAVAAAAGAAEPGAAVARPPARTAGQTAADATAAFLELVDLPEDKEAIAERRDAVLSSRVFAHPSGRALFLSELNWWRAHGRRLRKGLPRLGAALRRCLDACAVHDDVAAAKLLMIMSQTFYALRDEDEATDAPGAGEAAPEHAPAAAGSDNVARAAIEAAAAATAAQAAPGAEDGGKKRFASDWLYGHDIWARPEFWEEALYRSVREEAERPFAPFLRGSEAGVFADRLVLTSSRAGKGRERASTSSKPAVDGAMTVDSVAEAEGLSAASRARAATASPPPMASDGRGDTPAAPPFQPGSREWSYAYRQALFGQLGSYAMNMRAFGMPEEQATLVVARIARGNGLPAEMLQALLVSMDPTAATERRQARERRAADAALAKPKPVKASAPADAPKPPAPQPDAAVDAEAPSPAAGATEAEAGAEAAGGAAGAAASQPEQLAEAAVDEKEPVSSPVPATADADAPRDDASADAGSEGDASEDEGPMFDDD
ncbi:hypothetical protein FNF29_03175 [Cafeteria roenbergensis]|uniref:Uncharacterized protein n=1 Tax=Cafeteria roenbergensis TaxID=33653 RepID=A0A5A8CKU3_CAFRO|nr:hypothetical protein FNF29_03175 [Cafeteria roenbergensis]|eukprot:KAA0153358.1 hypothetical protein FNF29_03175 [Cafeteria roenbergensis]